MITDTSFWITAGAILCLLILSGFFSGSETALTAASRGTEIVSTNIANARTEGYARRELELSARVYERGGFSRCGAFADYPDSEYNVFYEKKLTA